MMFIPYNNQKGQLAIAKVVSIDNSIYQIWQYCDDAYKIDL